MRGNELLDQMELIDPAYVAAADAPSPKKKHHRVKWGALAACLCLMVGAALWRTSADPQTGALVLSDETTAKVSYGCESGIARKKSDLLAYFTEDELFDVENMYVFRGTVTGLTNLTIDFNGEKEARCVATIHIEQVYRGDLSVGEQITMLIPCPIDAAVKTEDTDVIAHLETGMEGIFMPWTYDDTSYWEMNGAKVMLRDLASCGLADGMRWAFLATDQGLLFERNAYPGAVSAANLDDIEAYIIQMLS